MTDLRARNPLDDFNAGMNLSDRFTQNAWANEARRVQNEQAEARRRAASQYAGLTTDLRNAAALQTPAPNNYGELPEEPSAAALATGAAGVSPNKPQTANTPAGVALAEPGGTIAPADVTARHPSYERAVRLVMGRIAESDPSLPLSEVRTRAEAAVQHEIRAGAGGREIRFNPEMYGPIGDIYQAGRNLYNAATMNGDRIAPESQERGYRNFAREALNSLPRANDASWMRDTTQRNRGYDAPKVDTQSTSPTAATGGFTARFLVGGTTNRNGTTNTGNHAHIRLPPEMAGRAKEVGEFLSQNGVTVTSTVRTHNAGADHPAGNGVDVDVADQSEADQVAALLNRHYGGQTRSSPGAFMAEADSGADVEEPVALAFSSFSRDPAHITRASQMAETLFDRYLNIAEEYFNGGLIEQGQQALTNAMQAFEAGELARGYNAVHRAVMGGNTDEFRALMAERLGIDVNNLDFVPDQAEGTITMVRRAGEGTWETMRSFTPDELFRHGMYALNDQYRQMVQEHEMQMQESLAEFQRAISVADLNGRYSLAEAQINQGAANQRAELEARNRGIDVADTFEGGDGSTIIIDNRGRVYRYGQVESPRNGGQRETTWQFTPLAGLQQ